MKIELEQFVPAAPERVFAVLSDFEHGPKVVPAIQRVEMLTQGAVRVGTRFRETRIVMRRQAAETMEVIAFDPPRSFSLRATSCGAEWTSTLRVLAEGGGARIQMSVVTRPLTFFARLMSPLGALFVGPMKQAMAGDLEAVRAHCARGPAAELR